MTRLSGAPPARPRSTAFAGLLEPHEKISDTLKYKVGLQRDENGKQVTFFLYLCISTEAEHYLEDDILKHKVLVVIGNCQLYILVQY